MLRWRLTLLLAALASSQSAWGASAALAKPTVFTNTEYVEGIAAAASALWVATRGGVEEYDLRTLQRRRVYTTNDGLPTTAIRELRAIAGTVVAVLADARCSLHDGSFRCVPGDAIEPSAPTTPRLFKGARITAELQLGSRRFVGTAGQGVWLAGTHARRLTPADQLCGNLVVAIAKFENETWLGTFDEGLCRFDGAKFITISAPFRMVNALASTTYGLFVATTSGLFRTRDGHRFESVFLPDTHAVNDLAVDGDALWATSPAVLWKIPLGRRGLPRGYWQPGGTHSLQAVDVANGQVWLASEDRGLLRMQGRKFDIFDRAAGLPTSWMVGVAVLPDGSVYGASLRHGLVRIDPNGKSTPVTGLPDSWLLHVGRGERGLWVGTQSGAASLDATGVHVLPSLPNPCVHAIEDSAAGVWVGTEGGLALYERESH